MRPGPLTLGWRRQICITSASFFCESSSMRRISPSVIFCTSSRARFSSSSLIFCPWRVSSGRRCRRGGHCGLRAVLLEDFIQVLADVAAALLVMGGTGMRMSLPSDWDEAEIGGLDGLFDFFKYAGSRARW